MPKSLQKGNTYPVEMQRKGIDEVMFIEANPKSINVYDATMSSVLTTDLLKSKIKQGKGIDSESDGKKKT